MGNPFFDPPVWYEPDGGNQCITGKAKPMVDETQANPDNIHHNRSDALEIFSKRLGNDGVFSMNTGQAMGQKVIGNTGH